MDKLHQLLKEHVMIRRLKKEVMIHCNTSYLPINEFMRLLGGLGLWLPQSLKSPSPSHPKSSYAGYSFDDSFADFRGNIGILIDSLRQASCNFHGLVA